jgi:hypothetical protein
MAQAAIDLSPRALSVAPLIQAMQSSTVQRAYTQNTYRIGGGADGTRGIFVDGGGHVAANPAALLPAPRAILSETMVRV